MLTRARQKGVGLAELMVSLVVSSFIVLAAATHYTITYRTTLNAQKTALRTQQFTTTEHIVSSALRESGYLGSLLNVTGHLTTTGGYDDTSSPTAQAFAAAVHPDSSNNCVIIEIGTATGADPSNIDEVYYQYGFRIDNNVVQTSRRNNSLACDSGTWADITMSEVLEFKSLQVTQNGSDAFVNADSPTLSALPAADCYNSNRANNCLIEQLWQLELCALPPDSDAVVCDDTTTAYFSEILVTPRNPLMTGATP
ncbi:prepilin-type N-terminal cleavage/methylation domain-containing protein [Luminiphilus sp.]|nr:prepilin-type N-terminal cleavage/methylation domain-containing protein [Luminiphilus sp.]